MEAKAVAKFVRFGPRKVGQVLNLIRGKSAEEALRILKFTPRSSALAVEKTLKSAVANLRSARDPGQMRITEAYVGQGPTLKRMRPSAMGRGAQFKRKTCHITIKIENIELRK